MPLSRRTVIGPVVLALAMAGATALTASPARAAAGDGATISYDRPTGTLTVIGTVGADTLVVGRTSPDADAVFTFDGTPVLHGSLRMNDVALIRMEGLSGIDTLTIDERNGPMPAADLFGGIGTDKLTGGSGADYLDGGDQNDYLTGGGGFDTLIGGSGNDQVSGGVGNDTVDLGDGDDQVLWGPGDGSDTVEGGTGSDSLRIAGTPGTEGLGAFPVGNGRSVITHNLVDGSPTQQVNFAGIEQVYADLSTGDDAVALQDLIGSGVRLIDLKVAPGPGVESAFDGVSVIADLSTPVHARVSGTVATGVTVTGLSETFRIAGAQHLRVTGSIGDDTIDASQLAAGVVALTEDGDNGSTGVGNDTLIGTPGDDALFGEAGNDRLEGRGGHDVLDGGTGTNVIIP